LSSSRRWRCLISIPPNSAHVTPRSTMPSPS
jgi:hypothetical protein